MTTVTTNPPFALSPQGYYVPSGEQPTLSYKKNLDGSGTIEGLKIFKAGTFRDSMGFQRTWEIEHLEQMIFHFGMLRDRGIFPNVPVRDGHPGIFGSGGTVIGYLESIERDDEFLIAQELKITEPDAYGKWERGTFRARSLEVGMYESNDESAYWPVVMGLAFVDIPAVEGLYTKYSNPSRRPERSKFHFAQTMLDMTKENPVADAPTPPADAGATAPAPPTTPAAPVAPAAPANPQVAPADGGTTTPPAGGDATTPESSVNMHSGNGQTMTFKINGQIVSDFGAVQRHITTLEGFRDDTIKESRKDFVKGLASSNKIAATQIQSLTDHALSLTDVQWDAFRASYDAAPQVPLFGQHAAGGGGQPAPSAADDEREILEARVAMHKRAGMPDAKLKETESYKRLQALKSSGTAA